MNACVCVCIRIRVCVYILCVYNKEENMRKGILNNLWYMLLNKIWKGKIEKKIYLGII